MFKFLFIILIILTAPIVLSDSIPIHKYCVYNTSDQNHTIYTGDVNYFVVYQNLTVQRINQTLWNNLNITTVNWCG